MTTRIPYGRQSIDDSDVRAVSEALSSDWLTQGPKVGEFEEALAACCGARHAVALSSGTAALMAAYAAAGLKEGDEFITSPITFTSTATAGLWLGARPVFADVDPKTGLLDPASCERSLTRRTKALVPVDYAGHPADLEALRSLAKKKGLILIEDACHALGASLDSRRLGSISDYTVFSFHPVKSITTGEGGAVLTDDARAFERLSRFRTHGISKGEDWEYSVLDMGLNYRLTDLQAALGLSQLRRLDQFISRRRELARRYDEALRGWEGLEPVPGTPGSAWHLYVVRLTGPNAGRRREVFRALREAGIGVQVHYIPVYRHPLYRKLGFKKGLCPNAEAFYESILSLPLYPGLTDSQQGEVVNLLRRVLAAAPAEEARR